MLGRFPHLGSVTSIVTYGVGEKKARLGGLDYSPNSLDAETGRKESFLGDNTGAWEGPDQAEWVWGQVVDQCGPWRASVDL